MSAGNPSTVRAGGAAQSNAGLPGRCSASACPKPAHLAKELAPTLRSAPDETRGPDLVIGTAKASFLLFSYFVSNFAHQRDTYIQAADPKSEQIVTKKKKKRNNHVSKNISL